jgi:hypothetical protein
MVPGEVLDARPVKAEDFDCSAWTKAAQQLHTPAVMDIVTPQQLGVGVSGGVEVKVLGLKLWYEKNMALGNRAVAVALDISNAHNTFDREVSIEALSFRERGRRSPVSPAGLARTHLSEESDLRARHRCGQRVVLPLRGRCGWWTRQPSHGHRLRGDDRCAAQGHLGEIQVEIRAIQDDMTMMGDPEQIFGPGKALESLLELLAKVNLSPSRAKFQCIGTTDDALGNAPDWLIFDE